MASPSPQCMHKLSQRNALSLSHPPVLCRLSSPNPTSSTLPIPYPFIVPLLIRFFAFPGLRNAVMLGHQRNWRSKWTLRIHNSPSRWVVTGERGNIGKKGWDNWKWGFCGCSSSCEVKLCVVLAGIGRGMARVPVALAYIQPAGHAGYPWPANFSQNPTEENAYLQGIQQNHQPFGFHA